MLVASGAHASPTRDSFMRLQDTDGLLSRRICARCFSVICALLEKKASMPRYLCLGSSAFIQTSSTVCSAATTILHFPLAPSRLRTQYYLPLVNTWYNWFLQIYCMYSNTRLLIHPSLASTSFTSPSRSCSTAVRPSRLCASRLSHCSLAASNAGSSGGSSTSCMFARLPAGLILRSIRLSYRKKQSP